MLPPPLETRVRTADFWREFLYVDETASDPWEPWDVTFPLDTLGSLRLSADAYARISLCLVTPSARAVEVAWDDQAHWHPHALRWTELDAICRSVARGAPAPAHPGVTLLLLGRFAPLTDASDAALALPLIEGAWARLGLTAPDVQARLLELCDFRRCALTWREIPARGWCVEQDEASMAEDRYLYSLRVAGNDGFPWVEWQQFVGGLLPGGGP